MIHLKNFILIFLGLLAVLIVNLTLYFREESYTALFSVVLFSTIGLLIKNKTTFIKLLIGIILYGLIITILRLGNLRVVFWFIFIFSPLSFWLGFLINNLKLYYTVLLQITLLLIVNLLYKKLELNSIKIEQSEKINFNSIPLLTHTLDSIVFSPDSSQFYILEIISSGCGACKNELDFFNQWEKEWKYKYKTTVIVVYFESGKRENFLPELKNFKTKIPVFLDYSKQFPNRLNKNLVPQTIVLDSNLQLIGGFNGFNKQTPEVYKELIENLIIKK